MIIILLASSTYTTYQDIQCRFNIKSDGAALIMTVLIFFFSINPNYLPAASYWSAYW
jgi:hypothetical protein